MTNINILTPGNSNIVSWIEDFADSGEDQTDFVFNNQSPGSFTVTSQDGDVIVVTSAGNDFTYFGPYPFGGTVTSFVFTRAEGDKFSGNGFAIPVTGFLQAAEDSAQAVVDLFGDITFRGNTGVDTVALSDGNDTLSGLGGADRLAGGLGDDRYIVDNAGDLITELAGQGNDVAYSTVNYTLRAGVAVETLRAADLRSTTALKLTGNELDNTLFGNDGANTLSGGGGADRMYGYAGNDTYFVDNVRDIAVEAAGAAQGTADRVNASVSFALKATVAVELLFAADPASTANLTLGGNDFNQTIRGNEGNNKLVGLGGIDSLLGGGGNDALYGGLGRDTLTGGSGNDQFVFDTALGNGNVDTIVGFSANASGDNDTIRLDNAFFTALTQTGTLDEDFFVANATGTAETANQHVVYNTGTGELFYDANGVGGAAGILFAKLSGAPTISEADFVVI